MTNTPLQHSPISTVELFEQLRDLETPSDEIDIRIWLRVGERLGTSQSDGRGRLLRASRTDRHFVPSSTWNGRDLAMALDFCLTHNREEILRIAHDWGVPQFTKSLDAARLLVGPNMILINMR